MKKLLFSTIFLFAFLIGPGQDEYKDIANTGFHQLEHKKQQAEQNICNSFIRQTEIQRGSDMSTTFAGLIIDLAGLAKMDLLCGDDSDLDLFYKGFAMGATRIRAYIPCGCRISFVRKLMHILKMDAKLAMSASKEGIGVRWRF